MNRRALHPLLSRLSYDQQGLQLRLKWNSSNHVILLSPAEGFRLTLHHPRAEPNPVGEGFDVSLKMNSFVGIRKMELERLHPDVGGDCAYDSYLTDQFSSKIFKIKRDAKYSKQVRKGSWFEFHLHYEPLTIHSQLPNESELNLILQRDTVEKTLSFLVKVEDASHHKRSSILSPGPKMSCSSHDRLNFTRESVRDFRSTIKSQTVSDVIGPIG